MEIRKETRMKSSNSNRNQQLRQASPSQTKAKTNMSKDESTFAI
jgi:hypothetical protein